MLYFNFSISNPWSKRFKNIKTWYGRTPMRNKYWEFQIYRDNSILAVEGQITTRQDHAGSQLSIGLFSWRGEVTFYDSRHWDHQLKRWE
jgi:hypothetical protein